MFNKNPGEAPSALKKLWDWFRQVFFLAMVFVALEEFGRRKPDLGFGSKARSINSKIDNLLKQTELPVSTNPREGNMRLIDDNSVVRTSLIRTRLGKKAGKGYYTWRRRNQVVGTIGMGLDRQLHFSNAFFIGFSPFPVANPWLAHLALSRQVKYSYDKDQFGANDLWLTSAEVFQLRRGDCEDQSMLLADWLISMGYDARVVSGRRDRGGHAWVVLFEEDKVYLLEAVQKRPRRTPPLAQLATNFHPRYMFNNEFIWHNTGGELNLDYNSVKWMKTARFIPGELSKEVTKKKKLTPETRVDKTAIRHLTRQKLQKGDFPARYIVITQSDLLKEPSYKTQRIRRLYQGEVLLVKKQIGDWFSVETANGWSGYVLRQDLHFFGLRREYWVPN